MSTAVVQCIHDTIFCCDQWYSKRGCDVILSNPLYRHHSPDCQAGVAMRKLDGLETVGMLLSRNGKEKIHLWRDSLPLTLLDKSNWTMGAYGRIARPSNARERQVELLGTSDGRIGIATANEFKTFNQKVIEDSTRYYEISPLDKGSSGHALEVQVATNRQFAYRIPNADFWVSPDLTPDVKLVKLGTSVRMLDGSEAWGGIVNSRWALYQPERFERIVQGLTRSYENAKASSYIQESRSARTRRGGRDDVQARGKTYKAATNATRRKGGSNGARTDNRH